MEDPIAVRISDWEFIFECPTETYPLGYYLYKPTNTKYSFEKGITGVVGKQNEQNIYDMWWLSN